MEEHSALSFQPNAHSVSSSSSACRGVNRDIGKQSSARLVAPPDAQCLGIQKSQIEGPPVMRPLSRSPQRRTPRAPQVLLYHPGTRSRARLISRFAVESQAAAFTISREDSGILATTQSIQSLGVGGHLTPGWLYYGAMYIGVPPSVTGARSQLGLNTTGQARATRASGQHSCSR